MNRRTARGASLELDPPLPTINGRISDDLSSKRMRIFGFPVRIRAGFGFFLLLIVFINGVPLGTWLAGSVAVFTLAHELGHAIAARRTGARASISLDFLAGYAAFVPTRHLHRWERAGISIAGPATQIVLGLIVLFLLGVNPLDHDDFAARSSTLAIWWAGPIIGVFNLIPVLPLDGGNIASEFLDFLVPGRGRELMIRISIPLTGGAFAYMMAVEEFRPLAAFAGILLVLQFQMYSSRSRPATLRPGARPPGTSVEARALDAENAAWTDGQPGPEVSGFQPSPWWRAFARAAGGDEDAGRVVLEDLRDESSERLGWIPPIAAPTEHLKVVLDLIPRPLPQPSERTPLASAMTLLDVLRRCGHHDEAIQYGTALFNARPGIDPAVEVARNLAVTRHPDLALQWLQLADRLTSEPERLRFLIRHCPEFGSLRRHHDLSGILGDQVSPTTTPNDTERAT